MPELNWYLFAAIGSILVVGGLAWPRVGLLAWWRRGREAGRRVLAEDALKHLHASEWRGATANLDSLAGALHLSSQAALRLIERLESHGWVRSSADGLHLTPEGEQLAVTVIRAHRLWERYLVDEARMPLAAVHAEAERREHRHTGDTLQALDAALGHPATDPHGDPIPTAEGQLARDTTHPLTDWPAGTPARITHVEDEPAAVFSQIMAVGLRPGQEVRVIEASAQRIVLSDGERTYTLAPVVAANIFVTPDGAGSSPAAIRKLPALQTGQQASVYALDDAIQGFTRRRLLDLGMTPGANIIAELPSLFGDPVAYRVRGTLIALRRDQAEHVLINLNGGNEIADL